MNLAPLLAPHRAPGDLPTAYLSVSFYNTDSVLQGEKRKYLAENQAPQDWQYLAEETVAAEAGYVVVELKSEDVKPADFDDLALRIVDPTTLQENHYDPFGQNLVGIEAEGRPTHLLQFNGKEKISDFGLFWNDHGACNLDWQGSRWGSIDPLAEAFPEESP